MKENDEMELSLEKEIIKRILPEIKEKVVKECDELVKRLAEIELQILEDENY